jgi:prevent-host-death family protein
MHTVTLAEAQQHLAELVRDLAREGELVITEADKPVARLAPLNAQTSRIPHLKTTPLAKCSTRGHDRG